MVEKLSVGGQAREHVKFPKHVSEQGSHKLHQVSSVIKQKNSVLSSQCSLFYVEPKINYGATE